MVPNLESKVKKLLKNFFALLPETKIEEATTIANRLCDYISQTILLIGKEEIRVTASMGLSIVSENCNSLVILMDCADQALYAAKEKGRNRVEILHQRTSD